jgi:hypothetical protein
LTSADFDAFLQPFNHFFFSNSRTFPHAGGRIIVIGIYIGMLTTVGSTVFSINYFIDYFFSVSTDYSILPHALYNDIGNFKVIVNFTSACSMIFVSLFMLYLSV